MRRKSVRPLSAHEVLTAGPVILPDGSFHTAHRGDWIVSAGEQVIDVVIPSHFAERYEIVLDGLLVPRELCGKIESFTGIGSTRSPEELSKAIEILANIEIGGVRIEFTPGQLAELKHRASKRGYTVEQELQRIIDRIRDEIFYHT